MVANLEKQHGLGDERSRSPTLGPEDNALAPTKSRQSFRAYNEKTKRTLSNKPDDVDAAIWLEEASVTGIKERKLSWIQAALLLLTEYVVLATLAFPYSFQMLGYAGGTLTTVIIGLSTYYTSLLLWRFCAAHPEVRDIADAAQVLCGGHRIGWYIGFIALALNAYCIMGLHAVAGATAVQTIRDGSEVTLVWAVVITILMWLPSNIRDFSSMTALGLVAAFTMLVCVLIVLCGHGVQGYPSGWTPGDVITHSVWSPPGTTFVQCVNAILNIAYTFIGHALIPSFIGDMEKPQEFPKALAVSMSAQLLLYTITGAVVYHYTGFEFTTAPAYGSLISKYGKVAAGFTLPTIVIVGVLYSLVVSRAIYFQIFQEGSRHRTRHTVKGWSTWLVIVFVGWVISFIIGEAVPFFSDLLSLISSLFSSWFGYIMWSIAYVQMDRKRMFSSPLKILETCFVVCCFCAGAFFFVGGTYASVQSIIDSYNAGAVKSPFTRANTGFVLDNR
ncbi:uncharacterized protein JCM10292_003519 [Rhodotorula paludigena]|uniref:uncharacterized protein n=1 Tax=Rhodotorula paludigena TaxID=86838 RepID=UPI00317F42E5